QIELQQARPGIGFSGNLRRARETAQHLLHRPGEFTEGHGVPAQFVFEVMEDCVSGVTDELRIEQPGRVASQFHRNHVGGIRDGFAGGRLEEQTIGSKRNHYLASSFFTSCTKSVASWKRRYTLAKRT